MNDLRFMIVNSNLQHSQALKIELDNRVSFDVYQDTEEKNIWGLMEGGKDDIYVYDRCGRLAYYIPFPLSIMNADDGLVPSAILATYFRSPCGHSCVENGRSSLEEFLNSNTDAPESTTDVVAYETITYVYETLSNVTELSLNETVPSENNEFLKVAENGSDFYSSEDFDYSTSNETIDDEQNNVTHTIHHRNNGLDNIFHENETYEMDDSNSTVFTNNSLPTSSPTNATNDIPMLIDGDHSHSETNNTEIETPKPDTPVPKRKFDRCAEADRSVCKNWSKRRLLRAQTCCSDQGSASKSVYCKNYGKKRCKKIRTVLKCCINTAYVQITTTEVPDSTKLVMNTTTVESTTVEVPTATVQNGLVCCKNDSAGRVCTVSLTSSCESDEFVQESPDPVNNVKSESKQ